MFENEGTLRDLCHDDIEIIEKFLTICIPVKITPNIDIKPVKAETCGKPIISTKKCERCMNDFDGKNCEFSIIQKMKVEIPIKFSIDTDIDNAFVDCELGREHDKDKERD